jgi:hypothetical protein
VQKRAFRRQLPDSDSSRQGLVEGQKRSACERRGGVAEEVQAFPSVFIIFAEDEGKNMILFVEEAPSHAHRGRDGAQAEV